MGRVSTSSLSFQSGLLARQVVPTSFCVLPRTTTKPAGGSQSASGACPHRASCSPHALMHTCIGDFGELSTAQTPAFRSQNSSSHSRNGKRARAWPFCCSNSVPCPNADQASPAPASSRSHGCAPLHACTHHEAKRGKRDDLQRSIDRSRVHGQLLTKPCRRSRHSSKCVPDSWEPAHGSR